MDAVMKRAAVRTLLPPEILASIARLVAPHAVCFVRLCLALPLLRPIAGALFGLASRMAIDTNCRYPRSIHQIWPVLVLQTDSDAKDDDLLHETPLRLSRLTLDILKTLKPAYDTFGGAFSLCAFSLSYLESLEGVLPIRLFMQLPLRESPYADAKATAVLSYISACMLDETRIYVLSVPAGSNATTPDVWSYISRLHVENIVFWDYLPPFPVDACIFLTGSQLSRSLIEVHLEKASLDGFKLISSCTRLERIKISNIDSIDILQGVVSILDSPTRYRIRQISLEVPAFNFDRSQVVPFEFRILNSVFVAAMDVVSLHVLDPDTWSLCTVLDLQQTQRPAVLSTLCTKLIYLIQKNSFLPHADMLSDIGHIWDLILDTSVSSFKPSEIIWLGYEEILELVLSR
ncbi:hypothetical protein BC830DRAFT_439479 [Chytriomyces sp. MP71]|nr:hypothetical protein BC830DRAFT_439479 [Chytriomyces sp. MP71]